MKKILVCIILVFVGYSGLAIAEEKPIGSIKTLTGKALILRQEEMIAAEIGLEIFQDDVLNTLDDGALGIILRDDTVLSLGPNSELAMAEFSFAPTEGKFSFLAKMVKGTFLYLSGAIGRHAPESVRLETPVGTIGIRGTKVLTKVEGD